MPYAKPAKLIIEASEKKYPFYAQGRSINLDFTIKNVGQSYAFDVGLEVLTDDVILEKPKSYLGRLGPTSILVEVTVMTKSPAEYIFISGDLRWINFDKSEGKESFEFRLEGQRSDIDWDKLAREDPYSIEAIENEDELVGRTEILDQLVAQAQTKYLGSSYLFGQKRVGKTSIAKALKTHLTKSNPCDFLVVYLQGGDYIHPNPNTTIENLGKGICEEIKFADTRFSSLEIPVFDGALSPLSSFLNNIIRMAPEYRILFILDEFDELPVGLYVPEPIGDAFFLTLRSISSKAPFGFILVGGERMQLILNYQGAALNKFQVIRVDYFDKMKHWSDFQDLIRRPVKNYGLEIADTALSKIYEQTAGNPYFAKMICKSLFKIMVENRDCHVIGKEVKEAINQALNNADINSFLHFWKDGVFEKGSRAGEVLMIRRRLILAFAEVLRQYGKAGKRPNYGKSKTIRTGIHC